MTKERIAELVKKYEIKLIKQGNDYALGISRFNVPTPNDSAEIKSNRQDIISYLLEKKEVERKATTERLNKINAIEGLEELERIIAEWDYYNVRLQRAIDNGSSILPAKPSVMTVDDAKAKYPRALAYLTAQEWSRSQDYRKADAGKKAVEKIINGYDYTKAIEEMEAEWNAEVSENIWN